MGVTEDLGVVVPEGWEKSHLGQYVKLQGGYAFKSQEFSEAGIPIIRISNVKPDGLDFTDVKFFPKEKCLSLDAFHVSEDEVLIAMSGATTGKTCVVTKDKLPAIVNQRVGIFRINNKLKMTEKFIQHIVNSKVFKQNVEDMAIGGAQPNISGKQIEGIDVILPPLPEQKKIAAILNSVDDAIAKTKAVIEQTKKLKKGMMQKLLTRGIGQTKFKMTEIGEIPEEWEVKTLGEIVDFINGRGFKPHEWKESGLPIIRIQNLNGGNEYNYYDGDYDPKLIVNPEELLFAWSGSRGTSFGPHIWKGTKGLLNYHTWKIILINGVEKYYLYWVLKNLVALVEQNAHGAAALVHIQKRDIVNYKVAVPTAKEQLKISSIMSSVVNMEISETSKLEGLTGLKQALMQQLLTGKVRVV